MDALPERDAAGGAEAADFAQRILQIVEGGSLTSTYTLALLLSLMDVCTERIARDQQEPIRIGELASKMVDLCWRQTLPYPGHGQVLHQSGTAGQARIVSLIRDFRVRGESGEPISPAHAKIVDPNGYQQLVQAVEEQLYRSVLLKLQTVAGGSEPFLYELPGGSDPRGEGSPRLFAGGLRLRPRVAAYLVRFDPLLRPLIQQHWAQRVAGLRANAIVHHAYELEEFLFGAERVWLAPVTSALRELQSSRCFYCRREVGGDRQVDPFIAWSRYLSGPEARLLRQEPDGSLAPHADLAGLARAGTSWSSTAAATATSTAAITGSPRASRSSRASPPWSPRTAPFARSPVTSTSPTAWS